MTLAGRQITVEWLDSARHDGWVAIDDVKPEGTHCVSRGILLSENDDWIVLASSVGLDAEGNITQALSPLEIPRCAIVGMY